MLIAKRLSCSSGNLVRNTNNLEGLSNKAKLNYQSTKESIIILTVRIDAHREQQQN